MEFQLSVYLNEADFSNYELNDSCVIGRDRFCTIRILNSIVSSEHCTLILMPKTKSDVIHYYAIRDGVFAGNSSRNGTWVNGARITQVTRLKNQDEITFGGRYPKAIFMTPPIENDVEKGTDAINRAFSDESN